MKKAPASGEIGAFVPVPLSRSAVPKECTPLISRSSFPQPSLGNPPRLLLTVSITQIWTAFLATLTTLAFGLLWVFAQDQGDQHLASEGEALRAVANASLAALETEIDRSQVIVARSFARDPRLVEVARKASKSDQKGRFGNRFRDLAYQGPIAAHPELNLALVDPWGDILAEAGVATDALHRVAKQTRRSEDNKERIVPTPVLTMLAGHPFVFSIRAIKQSNLRLISLAPLFARGEGPVRRTLGSQFPAALIQDAQVALELSGSGEIRHRLPQLPLSLDLPHAGIGEYFVVGKGVDRRLGVTGRLADKYYAGGSNLALLVLSSTNGGYQGEGFWDRFGIAKARLGAPGSAIALLFALWLASVGISIILPRMEWILPIQRLIVALEDAQSPGSTQGLANGRWSPVFEPLVIAIGRRILRTTTHRGWKISTRGAVVQAMEADTDAVTVTRDAAPTSPVDEPVPQLRKSA